MSLFDDVRQIRKTNDRIIEQMKFQTSILKEIKELMTPPPEPPPPPEPIVGIGVAENPPVVR